MLIAISGYAQSGKNLVTDMIAYCISQYKTHSQLHNKFDSNDTLGYQAHSDWHQKAFACKLKQIVSLLTGIPVADLEKESVKSSLLGPEWHYKDEWFTGREINPNQHISIEPIKQLSVRQLLQRLGTDAMRDRVHPNVHINALFSDYIPNQVSYFTGVEDSGVKETALEEPVYPNWIISDLRFPNEFQAIKNRGGICIRIVRKYISKEPKIVRPEHLEHGINLDFPQSRHVSETALDQHQFDYTINNSGTLEELLEQVRTMLLHFKIIT
jgi:hypothetical protein